MSRAVAVVALASILVATALANDCTTPTLPDNETATLDYFSGNVTVNGSKVTISPCGVLDTFPGCGNLVGYIATYTPEGACEVVYDRKDNTTYNYTLKQFRTRYYADNNRFDAMQELLVLVNCLPGAEPGQAAGFRDGNVITFRSETVCPGYTPPPPTTPAPTEAEKEGLSTGAIVGIVIGALAILIIVLVIFRWKAQKGEEEGEYQRV